MTAIKTNIQYHGTAFVANGIQTNQALQNYRNGIRAATRSLWKGFVDSDQFFDMMFAAINMGIPASWNEGAREIGVMPSELTPQERQAQRNMITDELSHVDDFERFIEQNSQANGGKLGTVFARAEMWILRAQDAKNNGVLSAKNDPKLKWVYDPTKENCTTCAKLHNKVKRRSYWERIGVKPQNAPNPQLECGGWKCGCKFEPTDEPLSKGRLPNLP